MTDIVNTGSSANDGTGDPLRTAMVKINAEFATLRTSQAGVLTWLAGSPQPEMDWLRRDAGLAISNNVGRIGLSGVSRASDKADVDVATYATVGVAGFAYNDKTSAVTGAWGGYFEAKRSATGTGPIYGIEIDATNNGAFSDLHAYSTLTTGSFGLWLGAGGGNPPNTASTDSTAAIWLTPNGAKWAKGLVIGADALRVRSGAWCTQVAVEMGAGQGMRWLDTTGVRVGYVAASYSDGQLSLGLGFGPNYAVFSNVDDDAIQFQIDRIASATSHIGVAGSAAAAPFFYANGAGGVGNVDLDFCSQNTGSIKFRTGGYGSGNIQVLVSNTVSATRYLTLTGSAGGNPTIGVSAGVLAFSTDVLGGGHIEVASTKTYKVNGSQVVGARDTGWTAMTGTPDKATSYATSSVTLAQLAGRVAQLQATLTTHGLIGA